MKLIKLSLVCFLFAFISACSDSPTSSSETSDSSGPSGLSVSSINEQATLKNVAKTVSLYATYSSYTQSLTFSASSSSNQVAASVNDSKN